jgi:pimeloyl-ACP methyl ester carboxylesterase
MELRSEQQLPLYLQPVRWARHDSHKQDLRDIDAQISAAARIACAVKEIRKGSPNVPIYFIGHSAGAHVVLRAAEMLPPKSVDRVIVLAPAVSCGYDLTRALQASRGGIDNFYSQEDSCLEHLHENAGNADGAPGKSAGLVGFRCLFSDPKDVAAYRNVRNYRWTMELDHAGGGGHYTWTKTHSMKRYVVPIFFAPTTIVDGPTVKTMPSAK